MRPGERREAAFGLPDVANSPDGVQSSSILERGTILQKEVVSKVIRLVNAEKSILSISEPCTAVDVYVDTTNVPLFTAGRFLFRIYAITGGVRCVVARGRINNSANGLLFERQRLVASARCASARFEITIERDFVPGLEVPPTSTFEFPVSAIGYQAADHPLAPPLHVVNVWVGSPSQQLLHAIPGEVTSMNGTNAEAAGSPARFIQLWDTTGAAGTGVLIEEIVSQPQDNWSVDYGDFPLVFQTGLVIGNSTTTALVGFTDNPAAFGTHIHEVR